MTYLVERLAELRRHLHHLHGLRGRAGDAAALQRDLSLHNDVLFSLLMVAQLVIDVAGELNARRGLRFDTYAEAIRNLAAMEEFPPELVETLARLPGFRNVLVHDYVALDLQRAVDALHDLAPIERFVAIVAALADGGA